MRGVRPLPFLIPLFGLATLFTVITVSKGGGWWWVAVVLPVTLLALIAQAILRGPPHTGGSATDDGGWAVRGDQSHESREALSPDEGGEERSDAPSRPKQPSP